MASSRGRQTNLPLIELTRIPQSQLLDYACHEGNYSVAKMLSGSRADEKRADKAK
jgi:hypothetical protein